MDFKYIVVEDWPFLSWLASCPISGSTINIYHGKNVEIHEGWFCEAIWDGPFEAGNFSGTDIVFGSGGHIWDYKNWPQQHPCPRSLIKSIRNLSFAFYYAMLRVLSSIFCWYPAFSKKFVDRADREILFKRVFPWAMERAIEHYATNRSRILADD